MKKFLVALLAGLSACSTPTVSESIYSKLAELPSISGKAAYMSSPFVAAGNRLYVVGHQDGSFPDLGWHVPGEMGGIWDHPIKLMDGYSLSILSDTSMCLPPAVAFTNFPLANTHHVEMPGYEVLRSQFVPDDLEGVVVEYLFKNVSEDQKVELNFTSMVDLRPVWLADSLQLTDGVDELLKEIENGFVAKDQQNPWYVAVSSSRGANSSKANPCKTSRKGNGPDISLTTSVQLKAGEETTLTFFIAGSYQSESQVHENLNALADNYHELLNKKKLRYKQLATTAKLRVPDENIEKMYQWTKYNTDWLMRTVPELGSGLSAGIPDYPWWFGTDNTYSLQGLLATGQHTDVKNTLGLIIKLSEKVNGNGRIMHEASTNGVVFNPGNLNTTPYFIHALWKYYLWTGDKAFLEKHYPLVKKGLNWLAQQDKNGNGYPDGAGMMEIHGLHTEMIDVVSYTQAAYASAHQMAVLFGDPAATEYAQQARQLKKQVNSEWWVAASSSYADFRATRAETIQLIDDAIVRADTINKPWSVEELQKNREQVARLRDNRTRGFVVHHNWVVNTPMEVGIADTAKALQALETAKAYTNRFGMYVTGIDRDENQEESAKWQAFSYVGAVMTLPTGVQAIAEARYGRPDEALKYLHMLANGFSYALPGSMYEVSPDYGMIAQAWNNYAVATPIVEHLFGISPNAGEKRITITPNFPSSWENVSLEHVKIGENELSIIKKGNELHITQLSGDWQITVRSPINRARLSETANGAKQKAISFTGESKTIYL